MEIDKVIKISYSSAGGRVRTFVQGVVPSEATREFFKENLHCDTCVEDGVLVLQGSHKAEKVRSVAVRCQL